jgi:hypothetical protein
MPVAPAISTDLPKSPSGKPASIVGAADMIV